MRRDDNPGCTVLPFQASSATSHDFIAPFNQVNSSDFRVSHLSVSLKSSMSIRNFVTHPDTQDLDKINNVYERHSDDVERSSNFGELSGF